MLEITPLSLPFIWNTTVNCYLIHTNDGFILIDTGTRKHRDTVAQFLLNEGCTSETLKLIVLTHGDFDHCGNAAYLSDKFNTPVAMHQSDRGMVQYGNMFWNRNPPNFLMKMLAKLLLNLDMEDRFEPDIYFVEGDNLLIHGFEATVVELPGHSSGSIGLLTPDGHLFCGDLLANIDKPDVWSIIDNEEAMKASVTKLKNMDIHMVYPGHGDPFPMHAFVRNINSQMIPV